MKTRLRNWYKTQTAAFYDSVMLISIFTLAAVMTIGIHPLQRFAAWSYYMEALIVIAELTICMTVFALRRLRESTSELLYRKQAEERERDSDGRYRLLAENVTDVIWSVDMNMQPTYMSPAITRLLGYSVAEAMAKPMEVVYTSASFETAMKTLSEELAIEQMKDKDPSRSRTLELELNRKDGSTVPVEVNFSLIRNSAGEPKEILAICRDITERKRMQEQLIAQDRLASIGELTSGIAHELNNPLSNVIGFSGLLLKRDLPADIEADLNVISSEAERAARIVDNLLTFARKQPEDKSPIDVNKIMEKTLELRTHEQKINDIQIVTRFTPGLPEIMGNDFQLRQVFLNIIMNAQFFMIEAHGKGMLTISTERAGDFIRISFTDDGPGIPRENVALIFNPFFTTKEVGKGTGLGLSICYGIVTEHGGRIWAEIKPGEGTTFIIELPVYKGPVTGSG
ncbi:nitrogen regulation protein NR(II) [Chloroflexota bacterium]